MKTNNFSFFEKHEPGKILTDLTVIMARSKYDVNILRKLCVNLNKSAMRKHTHWFFNPRLGSPAANKN